MDNSIAYETKMNAFIEHSGLLTISEPFSDIELENEKIFSESGENMLSQSEIPNNDALIESEKLDQITSHSIPSINMYQFIRRHKTKNFKVTKVNKLYSYSQSERKILITDANNLISSVIEAASATLKNNGDKKKRKRDFFENFKLYNQETLLRNANLTAIKENENASIEPPAKELAKNSKLALPEIPGLKEEKKSKKIIEPKTVTISKATVEKEQTSNLNSISLPQISKNSNDNANINSSNSDTANLKVKKKSKNPNKEKKEKKVFLLVI